MRRLGLALFDLQGCLGLKSDAARLANDGWQLLGVGGRELSNRRDACFFEGVPMVGTHERDEGKMIGLAPLRLASR